MTENKESERNIDTRDYRERGLGIICAKNNAKRFAIALIPTRDLTKTLKLRSVVATTTFP